MSRPSERRILFAAISAVGARDCSALNAELKRRVAWERLLSLAESSGLSPLLFEALRLSGAATRVPDGVLDQLERRYHLSAVRNAVLLEDLGRILDALADDGISVVVLKGAALVERLWRNIALRPMADIDLLFRKNELERAHSTLEKLGYQDCTVSHTPAWYKASHHHLVPCAHRDTGTVVELHRDIAAPNRAFRISSEGLWERARVVRIADRETRILSPEDALIHLCLHMACDDPFADKARSLADLVLLLNCSERDLNWSCIVSQARHLGIEPFVYYPLLLARERCAANVPSEVTIDLSRHDGQGRVRHNLLRRLMPLGLFRDRENAGLVPQWVAQRWCEALLFERSSGRRLRGFASAFALMANPDEEATEPSPSALAAGVFMAPFRVLRRMLRSMSATEATVEQPPAMHGATSTPTPIIEVRDLVKRYPQARRYREMLLHPFRRKEIMALEDVNLTVEHGEVVGLLGPNGAGKTTFIKILATLVLPSGGTVRVAGHDVETGGREVRRQIGYVVSEERSFYWRLTGRQNLRFYSTLSNLGRREGESRVEEVAELVGLRDALDRRFMEYSTGMRQRLAIARGLITRPSLVFLDEPTRALDPVVARDLRRFIREELADQGRTVLLATHNLQEAEMICDRVAVLHRGRILACSPPSELRSQFGERPLYRLTARARPDEVRRAFNSLRVPHRLLSVEPEPAQADRIFARFELDCDGTLLPDAITALIASGLPVESFGPEARSLEEAFAKLVES